MVTRKTRRMVTRAALWGVVGLLGLAALYLGLSTYRVYTRMVEVEELRVAAEAERDTLKERNKELTDQLSSLGTDRGIEAEIRTRYPLVKPGEVEFVLVGSPTSTEITTPEAPQGLMERIRGIFGL